jgi:uncharacterized damage-inducible protein DinB
MDGNLASFCAGWARYNAQLVEGIRRLPSEALQLKGGDGAWPIWAITAHTAGTRVYWLCGVLGEKGAENTPFPDASGEGWEDHLDQPRRADELIAALESSWQVVQSCLTRWTPEMLPQGFIRKTAGGSQLHTRSSVLTRMIAHDAYHCGEISLLLGMHGITPIDLWPPSYIEDTVSSLTRSGPD